MVRWNVLAGAAALIFALQTSPGVAPRPSSTPKTIIRTKTSPFCQTFRDNVFHAIEGLRINDRVLDEGHSLLSKLTHDGVVDPGGRAPVAGVPAQQGLKPASVHMDEYDLEQVVGQAAHNLQRVYGLLNEPGRFAEHPQSDAERDLASMKADLQAVADAQERSLNLLSGQYETAALYDLLGRGDGMAGALGQASVAENNLKAGDPILASPGSLSPPVGGAQAHGSLFASTPAGHTGAAVAVSRQLTSTENRVLSAVASGLDRCRDH